jgi:NADH-quinone oxidoreductase subunit L
VGVILVGNEPSGDFILSIETLMSVVGALIGVLTGWLLYTRYVDRLPPKPAAILKKAFYFDQIYWNALAVPLKGTAKWIASTLEPKLFDRSLVVIENATQGVAGELQQVQSGQIRSYVAWMAVGLVLLIVYLVL